MNKKSKNIILGLIIPMCILILWHLAKTKTDISSAILPNISDVIKSFISQIKSGQLFRDLSTSLGRVLKGYIVAALLGVTLGTIMGMSKKINSIFSLTLNIIRQIPMMAWIPLIILWCGIGETSKVVIIVLGAFFPIMVNTISGIQSTPKGYIELSQLYKLSKWRTFIKVYLPSALPQIFVGLKLGLGISWMAVVAAELVAATSGIGFRISDARSLMQPDVVIVGMIVIGIIGILMDKILVLIGKRVTPWINKK
ncbi:MAG: ABC transporter permease [Clostridium sp.]